MITIAILPHDPLLARDGRSFPDSAGGRMRCLDWPYPSVVVGSLRTLIGKQLAADSNQPFADAKLRERLLTQISLAGPLPVSEGKLFVPTPRDLVFYREEEGEQAKLKQMSLRPMQLKSDEGCCLPHPNLWPVEITENCKPANKMPAYWSISEMARWLAQDDPCCMDECCSRLTHTEQGYPDGFLPAFTKEVRVNVKIKKESYTAEDSMLFATEGLVMDRWESKKQDTVPQKWREVQLGVRVESDDQEIAATLPRLNVFHPLGGERRLALWQGGARQDGWNCPQEIEKILTVQPKSIRMILATPAIFQNGWLPGWLDRDTLRGNPPGTSLSLRLRGACVDRWRALSGWNLDQNKRGPKPIRRLVPAGSVYFFEVEQGKTMELSRLWLTSVADAEQDRRDGFGLALWGIWNHDGPQQ